MTASGHIADSAVSGHLWSTEPMRRRFSDRGRLAAYLDILKALARAQSEQALVPAAAADEIARLDGDALDLDALAVATRATGHSMAGVIDACAPLLGDEAREFFYFGATVQDVTDTWTAVTMRDVLRDTGRALRRIEGLLVELAGTHRGSLMLGRTHAQPGAPVSFAFKLLVWGAELRRHVERVIGTLPRVSVVELTGAVGVGSGMGLKSAAVECRLAELLDLGVPEIAWLTARDRIAEFTVLVSMVTGTLAKIGNEIKQLQRYELGELREGAAPGTIGSITMPHKRNPERSEQLVTLARVTRSAAALSLEGLVHEHERDGAAWKTEWHFVPEACMATSAALELAEAILGDLEADPARMRANIAATRGYAMSESVMMGLAMRIGKQRAHELVYRASMEALEADRSFDDVVRTVAAEAGVSEETLHRLTDLDGLLPVIVAVTDRAASHLERARASDPDWLRTGNGGSP